jgi:uncharacterized protein (TIGR03083 family)
MTDTARRSRADLIASLYREAHAQFVAVADLLEASAWTTPVPACPGWTAHDVLAHVSGVADDVVHGRIEGAATDPWTAAQVERGRRVSERSLLDRWAQQVDEVAAIAAAVGEVRLPLDLHTHEHDLRGALGRPGNRSNPVIDFAAPRLATSLVVPAPLTVRVDGTAFDLAPGGDGAAGGPAAGGGTGAAVTSVEVGAFELFRSRLGRRTPAQVAAYRWRGDPTPFLAGWFLFGPATTAVVE